MNCPICKGAIAAESFAYGDWVDEFDDRSRVIARRRTQYLECEFDGCIEVVWKQTAASGWRDEVDSIGQPEKTATGVRRVMRQLPAYRGQPLRVSGSRRRKSASAA